MRRGVALLCATALYLASPVAAASDALGIAIHLDAEPGPHFAGTPITLHVTVTNTSDSDGLLYATDLAWVDRHEDGSTTKEAGYQVISWTPPPKPLRAGETLRFDITRRTCEEPLPCRMRFAAEYSGRLSPDRSWTADSNVVDVVAERDPTATFRDQPNGDRAIVSVAGEVPVTFAARATRLRFDVPANASFSDAIKKGAEQLHLSVLGSGGGSRDSKTFASIDIAPQPDPSALATLGRDIASAAGAPVTFDGADTLVGCDESGKALQNESDAAARRVERLAAFLGTTTDRVATAHSYLIERPPAVYGEYCFGAFNDATFAPGPTYAALVSATAHTNRVASVPDGAATGDLYASTQSPDPHFQTPWTTIGDRPELLAYAASSIAMAGDAGRDPDAEALENSARYAAIVANALNLHLDHPSLVAAIPDDVPADARTVAIAETFDAPGPIVAAVGGPPIAPPATPAPLPRPSDIIWAQELRGAPFDVTYYDRTFRIGGEASAPLRSTVGEPCADAIARATRDAAFAANSKVRSYETQPWFDGARLLIVTARAPLAAPASCTSLRGQSSPRMERITVSLELTYGVPKPNAGRTSFGEH